MPIPTAIPSDEAATPVPAITLSRLLALLSELTDDEDEIVATALHMVERRSVRLVAESF